jgi:hypothetical protein
MKHENIAENGFEFDSAVDKITNVLVTELHEETD